MVDNTYSDDVNVEVLTDVLASVLPAFKKLNHEGQERLLQTIVLPEI